VAREAAAAGIGEWQENSRIRGIACGEGTGHGCCAEKNAHHQPETAREGQLGADEWRATTGTLDHGSCLPGSRCLPIYWLAACWRAPAADGRHTEQVAPGFKLRAGNSVAV